MSNHRGEVGGLWDELGQLQFRYLVDNGLQPSHTLLDIGCGCLRGGVKFIEYLETNNYAGIDASRYLLEQGREIEVPLANLQDYEYTLVHNSTFDFKLLGRKYFDFLLAQSVFTHLPLTDIVACLIQAAQVMHNSSIFYATFFEVSTTEEFPERKHHTIGGVDSYPTSDPYHYTYNMLREAATNVGLNTEYIGNWNHPRDQQLISFRLKGE